MPLKQKVEKVLAGVKTSFSRFRRYVKVAFVQSKKTLGMAVIVILVLTLPLFVWGVNNNKFLFEKRAASGEPTPTPYCGGVSQEPCPTPYPTPTLPPPTSTPPPVQTPTPKPTPVGNSINWSTNYARLAASNFYITIVNTPPLLNRLFIDNSPTLVLHSDPGNPTYTTLEATWSEEGTEMRLFFYFSRNLTTNTWSVSEIRTYNGNLSGDWIYYPGIPGNTVGSPLTISNANYRSVDGRGMIHFENLNLQPFFSISSPTPTPIPGECSVCGGTRNILCQSPLLRCDKGKKPSIPNAKGICVRIDGKSNCSTKSTPKPSPTPTPVPTSRPASATSCRFSLFGICLIYNR
jgi:hypothetical protein